MRPWNGGLVKQLSVVHPLIPSRQLRDVPQMRAGDPSAGLGQADYSSMAHHIPGLELEDSLTSAAHTAPVPAPLYAGFAQAASRLLAWLQLRTQSAANEVLGLASRSYFRSQGNRLRPLWHTVWPWLAPRWHNVRYYLSRWSNA